ncbi:phosphotransferase [Amycolatopsis sp. cmx-11-32]|uniref:phosphotransferase n=1 Tax=Amycolatopsis sp. cmx-11-32 TaxID=2785796 RepID=UPI0039E41779
MSTNYEWDDLPDVVRMKVQDHIGEVASATANTDGQTSDVAATLDLASGEKVFLKGVCGISRRMRFLRNEATAGDIALGLSPEVLFHEDITVGNDDWFVVGFEHVTGRAANLAPSSIDFPLIAATVSRIAELPANGFRSLRDRWSGGESWQTLADESPDTVAAMSTPVDQLIKWEQMAPELVHGDRLVHTDLHKDQFIIDGDSKVHVIDWGFPGAGQPWIDSAFLTIRLIGTGHNPERAESWAREATPLSVAGDDALTAFTVYISGLWSYWAATDSEPGATERAQMARDYAAYRLSLKL